MKKVKYRHSVSRVVGLSLAVLLAFSVSLFAQEGDPVKGKSLFNTNCAACHKLDKPSTGPALAGVADKYERGWLQSWIRNSSALVKSGDADAVKIFNEWKQVPMTPFPQLSDQDIDDILAYTMAPPPAPEVVATDASGVVSGGGASSGISNNVILSALALVFALLIVMLYLVNKTLRKIAEANGVQLVSEEAEKRLPLWKAFVKNQFLVLVSVVFLLLASAYFAYGYFMQVGVDQGYMPVQPIHYSHKVHAA